MSVECSVENSTYVDSFRSHFKSSTIALKLEGDRVDRRSWLHMMHEGGVSLLLGRPSNALDEGKESLVCALSPK